MSDILDRKIVHAMHTPIPEVQVYITVPGYLPDAEDRDVVDTIGDLLDTVVDHLATHSSGLEELAESHADEGLYEAAWKAHKEAQNVDVQVANLNWRHRLKAPIYKEAISHHVDQIHLDLMAFDGYAIGDARLYVEYVTED